MMGSRRKPYEEIIAGYYRHGEESYILMDPANRHKFFVAVHERTHLNLGTSTSTGLFQQFLQFLLTREPYRKFPGFIESMFRCSCEHSRVPHEAAATYAAFCSAQHNGYPGLEEMERELPEDYRKWRMIFANFFPETISPQARGLAGYHIARLALDSSILEDYTKISYDKIQSFHEYMAIENNSPNLRLRTILSAIDRFGKDRFFKEYLEYHYQISDVLNHAYDSRTLENRRVSFGIQSKIFHIMMDAADKLTSYAPFLNQRSLPGSLVPSANRLVQKWIAFLLKEGYVDDLNFHFVDTDDGADVDALDEKQVLVSRQSPQSTLFPLEASESILLPKSCLARIWAWGHEEPFFLSQQPYRILKKGDLYVRLFPFTDSSIGYFSIIHDPRELQNIVSAYAGSVVIDEDTYNLVHNKFSFQKADVPVLVLWRNLDSFCKKVVLPPSIAVCDLYIPSGDVFLLIINSGETIYHCLLAMGAQEVTLKLDRITKDSDHVSFLSYPKELESTLITLNKLFQFLV